MEESEEELKNILIWVKIESEKASQKLNIKTNKQTKTKIMAIRSHHFMKNRRGRGGNGERFPLLGL